MIRSLLAMTAMLVLGSSAFATSLSPIKFRVLPEGTERVLLISGDVTDVSHAVPRCGPPKPGDDPCTNLTTINIDFNVGCLDDLLVTHTASFNRRSNKIVVDVTALQLSNPKSRAALCIRANTKHATVEVKTDLLRVNKKDVEVRFQRDFTSVR